MLKKEFTANIQSKDKANCRKMIELPPDIREKFNVRDHVKVSLKRSGDERRDFFANVQSKKVEDGRKVIELPPHIRSKFKVGDSVKVIIELM